MPSMAADWVLAGSADQGQTKLGERDEVTGDYVRHAGVVDAALIGGSHLAVARREERQG
jgi:hypothetical protein